MGRDKNNDIFLIFFKSFNPRARMGRDLSKQKQEVINPLVSIHAPAWGATLR